MPSHYSEFPGATGHFWSKWPFGKYKKEKIKCGPWWCYAPMPSWVGKPRWSAWSWCHKNPPWHRVIHCRKFIPSWETTKPLPVPQPPAWKSPGNPRVVYRSAALKQDASPEHLFHFSLGSPCRWPRSGWTGGALHKFIWYALRIYFCSITLSAPTVSELCRLPLCPLRRLIQVQIISQSFWLAKGIYGTHTP